MFYVVTEWDGKGSGEVIFEGSSYRLAMQSRKNTRTFRAAMKEYGPEYFRAIDVRCTTLDRYKSQKACRRRDEPSSTKHWY